MRVERIRIEHMEHPIGIDITNPLVSWNVYDGKQDKYRIIAKGNKGSIYDSGEIRSDEMQMRLPVSFQSKEQVQIMLHVGGKVYSTGFEIGLQESDWKAKWINPELVIPLKNDVRPASYLRTNFYVSREQIDNSKYNQMRLYATSHGVYQIYINGKLVEGFVMAPGTSEYRKLLQYQTYDVSGYFQEGKNEILCVLGDGWWRGTTTYDGVKNGFGRDVAFLAQLEIDGEIVCMTDERWEATQNGPLRLTDNMQGEIYDARLEGLSGWHKVNIEEFGYENLCCSNCPPVLEHERFHPVLLISPKGEKILDFGQNIAGYIGFNIWEEEGVQYRFIHGETLDGEGNFYMNNFQSMYYYCAQEVRYICKKGENRYKASHTFMGFRYVKIEGMDEIDPDCFTAYAVYTDLEETAKFSCGRQEVNQLFQNALWSLKGNLIDIPTDCPTREKSGFTGDLVTYIHTFLYMMDCYPMVRKFIRNQAASQFEDGCVRQIIGDPRARSEMDGAAGWSNSFEIVSEKTGDRYGEYSIFEEYYDAIKKWVDFLIERAASKTRKEHLTNPYHEYLDDVGCHWGEWLEPGMNFESYIQNIRENGEPEVGTAYYAYACKIMSRRAESLAKKYRLNKMLSEKYRTDANYYGEISEKAKGAYYYQYTENGNIDSRRMCRYIRPIMLDLLSEGEKVKAADDLNQMVREQEYRLNTGFLTTHELCRTLSDYGHVETAYRLLLNEDMPGWLYPVEQGATTIPENWLAYQPDGSRKESLNHYSYGAIAGWLLDTVAGIRVNDTEITICPKPFKELKFAKGEYLSPMGKIESSWKYRDEKIEYTFYVPGNCVANVVFPTGEKMNLREGFTKIIKNNK